MVRKVLLICGILSSLLYLAMNVVVALAVVLLRSHPGTNESLA